MDRQVFNEAVSNNDVNLLEDLLDKRITDIINNRHNLHILLEKDDIIREINIAIDNILDNK